MIFIMFILSNYDLNYNAENDIFMYE